MFTVSACSTSFVYGTLMVDNVVHALIRRVPDSRPAVLQDHQRFRVKGAMFPAIVACPGAQVHGKVLPSPRPSVSVLTDSNVHV